MYDHFTGGHLTLWAEIIAALSFSIYSHVPKLHPSVYPAIFLFNSLSTVIITYGLFWAPVLYACVLLCVAIIHMCICVSFAAVVNPHCSFIIVIILMWSDPAKWKRANHHTLDQVKGSVHKCLCVCILSMLSRVIKRMQCFSSPFFVFMCGKENKEAERKRVRVRGLLYRV